MTSPHYQSFVIRDIVRLDHLFLMVQDHQAKHGDANLPASCSLDWHSDDKWGLSIVCPGHYAFERYDQDDVSALIEEAVAYYAGGVPLWKDSGCQEHHPDPMPSDGNDQAGAS